MNKRTRGGRIFVWLALIAAGLSGLLAGPVRAATPGSVVIAEFRGPVTPVLASYLDRAIGDAESTAAAAVIVELDTPGGSTDITKQITQRMAAATVPVIVYVSPAGAHAGSAGTFITLGAHLAAMAPGSSIGAASPVGSGGQDLPATEKAKLTNILVADIKNLAARRGPEAQAWAEKAVSEAAAATAEQAKAMGVVDYVATDLPDLLRQLEGRQVQVAGGRTVTLHVNGQPQMHVTLNPIESLLNAITDPSIAAILLTLGTTGLLAELYNPGTYLPGVAGAVCLLLAFYALGVLQANLVGLGFVALAFILFVVDIKAPTHGFLTFGGIASFLLGGFLLFNTPNLSVPWVTLSILALATAAFFAFAIAKAVAAHQRRPVTGMDGLIGMHGEVRQALEPNGMVLVDGELWRADVQDGPVPAGEQVTVIGHEGFTLHVRRAG